MFKVKKCKLAATARRQKARAAAQAPQVTLKLAETPAPIRKATLSQLLASPSRKENLERVMASFSERDERDESATQAVDASDVRTRKPGGDAPERARTICFVAPSLPHPCEVEIWNGVVKKLDAAHGATRGVILTAQAELRAFAQFHDACRIDGVDVVLECRGLETTNENKTFLAGLESELRDATLVVCVGEASIASYQAMKARRQHQNRLVLWQNAPRPPASLASSKAGAAGAQSPFLAREKTIRREVLRSCDAVIAFDKDSATWAYLEDVNAQRIRRVVRGINTARFTKDLTSSRRIELRRALGLPEADFIYLQSGPLEIEAGALDTVYAFKNLLQSHAALVDTTKLVFCGTGSASADVRQAVVDLRLDDQVYFLNPNDPDMLQILGNQMSTLLSVCDAIVHNPLAPTNGSPARYLDCSFDVLCAVAGGLTVVSNGNGWAGEWLARFYRTFATGSIHSQARMMSDAIEKQDKLSGIKRAARKAIENELELRHGVDELAKTFEGLFAAPVTMENQDIAQIFEQIEKTVQAKRYLDAIQLIGNAFAHPQLSQSQRATLFRFVADSFTKLGDLENGLQNYARALELDPYCAKTLIGLGTIALQTHNYIVAVPQFQKAVALSPSDDMASLGLGLAFEGLGEAHEALNWTVRACNLNIENTAAIFNLVKLAHDLERFAEAEAVLTRYVGLHPHDANMVFTLGGIAFKTGRVDVARHLMENILSFDPMNSRAHSLLAQINRRPAPNSGARTASRQPA